MLSLFYADTLPMLTFRNSQEAVTKRRSRNVHSLLFYVALALTSTASPFVLRPWLASQSEAVQEMDRAGLSKAHPLVSPGGFLQPGASLPFPLFSPSRPGFLFIPRTPSHPAEVKPQSPEERASLKKWAQLLQPLSLLRFLDRYS